jgi:aryl carrier-like protein
VDGGAAGEMLVGGPGVARGYLDRPRLTAERFVPDGWSGEAGARVYRSGDLARDAGGRLEYIGRNDTQIKLHGFRIEPGEIKAALNRHPAVANAAVIAREHANGERMLSAYLVPVSDAHRCHPETSRSEGEGPRDSRGSFAVSAAQDDKGLPTTDELRRFAAERLPQYMVPATYTFIDALPLTPNGKLDVRSLPAPQWLIAEEELVPARTPTEERIAAIWAEVIGVERVGVTQDFFAIGGDSIRSIRIVARCKRENIHLRPSDLFQHPTVAALAALADSSPRSPDQEAIAPALHIHPELLDLALSQVEFDEA